MIATAFLVVLAAVASVNSEAQFLSYPQYPQFYDPSYFANPSESLHSTNVNPDSRFFFGGALLNAFRPTLTLATSTTTSTVTISSTCTTSTAALTTCSPAGRRRRGLLLNNKKRSLFYAEDDHETDNESVFLPHKPEEAQAAPVEESVRESRSATPNLVPFIVQPGFNAPEELRGARQLISVATRTITSTTTTTTTARLTAVCLSATGFPTC